MSKLDNLQLMYRKARENFIMRGEREDLERMNKIATWIDREWRRLAFPPSLRKATAQNALLKHEWRQITHG